MFEIESLEFTVFVFDLFYKEVSPFNTVSMVVIEFLMVSHPISNLWILVLCLCFVLSRICLLSCSIFRFASLNFPFSFIFLFTERIIKSFNYFTYFRSNFCLFLLILLKLLCISSVTLLVLLNLCIVSFFVVVPFCFF